MNKTSNYQLNQWERDDRVLMEDFNADNAKIDGALAGKADVSALSALQAKVDEKCEVVVGTYTGDGAEQRNIVLGRKPKAVLVFSHEGSTYTSGFNHGGLALPGAPVYRVTTTQPVLTVTDTGFTVYYNRLSSSSAISSNNSGALYHYIAFC